MQQMADLFWPILAVAGGMVLMSSTPKDADVVSALQRARHLALRVLHKAPKGSLVVFDFDDTLFDPHDVIDHEHTGTRTTWHSSRRAVPIYRPIREMIDVLQVASAMGHYVVLITARHDTAHTRAVINANFRKRGMKYNLLYASQTHSLPDFKARLRSQLAAQYNLALTIGDQWGDVRSPGRAHWIKLPDRRDRGLYASL